MNIQEHDYLNSGTWTQEVVDQIIKDKIEYDKSMRVCTVCNKYLYITTPFGDKHKKCTPRHEVNLYRTYRRKQYKFK